MVMRRVNVCLWALLVFSSTNAIACGDKYVVFGQGVRFQRAYAAAHPANILLYLNPGSKWAAPENRERLLTLLRMVGHRPEAVSTIEELQAAVTTGHYDIVLTEFSAVAPATQTVANVKVRPSIIPMVFEPTRQEMKDIERQNSCAVQVSKRSHELLSVINGVMDQRLKGVIEACQRKRV
jgi:hypothetical protein